MGGHSGDGKTGSNREKFRKENSHGVGGELDIGSEEKGGCCGREPRLQKGRRLGEIMNLKTC